MIENERVPSKAQDEALWLERTAEIDLERSKGTLVSHYASLVPVGLEELTW